MSRISGGATFARTLASHKLARLERLRLAAALADRANAEDLPVLATPPAYSQATGATGSLSRVYTLASHPAVFQVSGGIPVENTTRAGFWLFPVTKVGNGIVASGNLSTWTGDREDFQNAWSLTFLTDADMVEFKLAKNTTAGRNYRFIIDGQYLDKTGTDLQPLGGTTVFVKLDFSALAPARRMRTITIEGAGSNQHSFASVAVGPTSSIAHPGTNRTHLLALFGGDSFTEGENASPAVNKWVAWPYRACKRLGIPQLYDLAIGTTGYVNTGSGNRRKLVDQIAHDWGRAAFANADLIVLANGYNDKASAAINPAILATIRTEARSSWAAVRLQFPDALVVILGVFGGKSGPNADTVAAENGLKAEFDSWADDFALWLPVSTDPAPWQFGTGNVAAPTGDGNSDVTTSNDNVHPSDYGHDVIAHRFTAALRYEMARMRV